VICFGEGHCKKKKIKKRERKDKSEIPQSNQETSELTLQQDKASLGSHQASPDGLRRHQRSTETSATLPRQADGYSLLCKYSAVQGSKEVCQTVKTAGTTKDVSHFQGRQCDRELSYKTDSAHGIHDCQLDNNFSEFSAYFLS